MSLSLYFLLFIIYSMIGWVVEELYIYYTEKILVNRGFLIGPYCPIYGYCSLLMIFLLNKYSDNILIVFVMSMFICAVLEYLTSYLMEKIWHARWWDYSNKKFNINGRVCLETLIPFGILGCLLIYVLNPFFNDLLSKFSEGKLNAIALTVLIVFLIDNVVSYTVITKIRNSSYQALKDNTVEITKKSKEYISKHSKFGKRLIKSFPSIKFFNKTKKKSGR